MDKNTQICIRTCPICSNPVKGRHDKVFCSDYCRNAYNNLRNSDRNNFIRNINNTLRRNRRILESLISNEEQLCKVRRGTLVEQEFNFKYHTHLQQGLQGETLYYVYDFGYQVLDDNWVMVMRSNRGEV
jgi:predicted nucleic acid-binding Zn ribbon protein